MTHFLDETKKAPYKGLFFDADEGLINRTRGLP